MTNRTDHTQHTAYLIPDCADCNSAEAIAGRRETRTHTDGSRFTASPATHDRYAAALTAGSLTPTRDAYVDTVSPAVPEGQPLAITTRLLHGDRWAEALAGGAWLRANARLHASGLAENEISRMSATFGGDARRDRARRDLADGTRDGWDSVSRHWPIVAAAAETNLRTRDHRAVPTPMPSGALACRICGRPVRTALGGRFPIHAQV